MDRIRVSVGTAAVLGMKKVRGDVKMETAYLLTYHSGRCRANCQFCAQAKGSNASLDRVARGIYPPYPLEETVKGLEQAIRDGLIKRVCIQTVNHPTLSGNLTKIIRSITRTGVPITVSRHPMDYEELNHLLALEVDRVTIPLDAVTKELFDEIKGVKVGNPYTWEGHWKGLKRALEVFGKGKVGTHIILGFGETEEEAIKTIDRLHKMGISPGLFAFVPIKGTPMGDRPKPPVLGYRRVQLAYYLIRKGFSDFVFEDGRLVDFGIEKEKLNEIIETGKPFLTIGCPNCNRPYSTEGPLGPIYNFATLPTERDIDEIKRQLNEYP
jgi:biotin synthase